MTGLPPPARDRTEQTPPRVELTSTELTVAEHSSLPAVSAGADRESAPRYRANLSAGLLPAALIVFLLLAFVAIVWTVVAAGG